MNPFFRNFFENFIAFFTQFLHTDLIIKGNPRPSTHHRFGRLVKIAVGIPVALALALALAKHKPNSNTNENQRRCVARVRAARIDNAAFVDVW